MHKQLNKKAGRWQGEVWWLQQWWAVQFASEMRQNTALQKCFHLYAECRPITYVWGGHMLIAIETAPNHTLVHIIGWAPFSAFNMEITVYVTSLARRWAWDLFPFTFTWIELGDNVVFPVHTHPSIHNKSGQKNKQPKVQFFHFGDTKLLNKWEMEWLLCFVCGDVAKLQLEIEFDLL